ncbi:hypothetical protein M472_16345 [Sphingobacterium paucimobilis HER1398]|uniref:Uncharacterized protein n=1 Tax=Sphingobacterium paucimobilis HER1398 TaxID=1346330 RepID=U2IYU1_9SPHI|nr:hypothetical protein M472_03775 [Sphingobacterium paucimobilis HER1398]ERJ60330.1 hypothetical protein M472_16345 [Sphingobacterium paucimobilis HER1398]
MDLLDYQFVLIAVLVVILTACGIFLLKKSGKG